MRWSFFKKWFLLSSALFFVGTANAQQGVDSLRAFYVQEYPNDFFIWPVLKYRSLSFEVRDRDNAKNKVSFRPNNTSTFGLGFYVFDVGFEVTFAVPLGEQQKLIYGESKARDLQINVLTKSWGIDVYRQKYSGFYKDDYRVKIPKKTPYPQRPDIVTRNFGVSGFYVLNHREFSLRSSYNYAERQLRKRGSVILYGTLNSFKADADSAILSPSTRIGFGEGADFEDIRYTTLSVAPGYSYNLVVKKFFVNGTLTFGPAHHWVYYQKEDATDRYDVSFNATYSLRLALGYSNDRVFGGIGLVAQGRVVKFEDIRFENASNTLRVLVGYRFEEKGILKKHIWDFIPFLKN
jgi:hypothetical protein